MNNNLPFEHAQVRVNAQVVVSVMWQKKNYV